MPIQEFYFKKGINKNFAHIAQIHIIVDKFHFISLKITQTQDESKSLTRNFNITAKQHRMKVYIEVAQTLLMQVDASSLEPRHEISNNVVCANQQCLRSACAYAQSDQSLC